MGSILGLGRGKKAAKYALQGFNYLQDNPLIKQAQDVGSAGYDVLNNFLSGDQAAFDQGLANFREGSGYQDQLQQGSDAITGNAAVRGSLNSGATLKGLQRFGQNLANQSLMQYLGLAQGAADRGQQAALGVGAAGSSGGAAAASSQPKNTGILGRFFGI